VTGPSTLGDTLRGDGRRATTILLVEDDDGDAFLVQDLLDRSDGDFSVTRVATLAEAVRTLSARFECVLLDLGLPDAVGFDALEALLEKNPLTAVVVLTGHDDREVGAKALGLGAQDYITKGSVTEEILARTLRYAIARRQTESATRQLREAELMRAENARLERGLLARPIIRNEALKWATRYQPGGRRALLGGDFFDAIELDDGSIRIVIGDICGHGPDEAALGVALRVAWRALVLAGTEPELTIPALQRVLEAERQSEEIFATVCEVRLHRDLRRADLYLAGHPSPLLLSEDGVTEGPEEQRGPLLGVIAEATWPVNVVDLGERWTLLVFTDGIIEGHDGSSEDRFEVTGLARLAVRSMRGTHDLERLADQLILGAEQANGEPLCDDVALLVLSTSPHWTR
jgi:serine phosphatase RsbU (regulator of sigma subunit)